MSINKLFRYSPQNIRGTTAKGHWKKGGNTLNALLHEDYIIEININFSGVRIMGITVQNNLAPC